MRVGGNSRGAERAGACCTGVSLGTPPGAPGLAVGGPTQKGELGSGSSGQKTREMARAAALLCGDAPPFMDMLLLGRHKLAGRAACQVVGGSGQETEAWGFVFSEYCSRGFVSVRDMARWWNGRADASFVSAARAIVPSGAVPSPDPVA